MKPICFLIIQLNLSSFQIAAFVENQLLAILRQQHQHDLFQDTKRLGFPSRRPVYEERSSETSKDLQRFVTSFKAKDSWIAARPKSRRGLGRTASGPNEHSPIYAMQACCGIVSIVSKDQV
jgi:hypothetical protein